MKQYINLGCGQTLTPGFENYDGSPSVFLSRFPLLVRVLSALRLINGTHRGYIGFCVEHGVRYANVCRMPFEDRTIDGIYACHVAEHLRKPELAAMLSESRRCLRSGGWIRLAVPDIKKLSQRYLDSGNADTYVAELCMADVWDKISTFQGRLQVMLWGQPSCHKWMYDGESLAARLTAAGFVRVAIVNAGETTIADPGELNLSERSSDSVYVEAHAP